MPHPQTTPLRPIADEERAELQQVARSRSQRADRVARARALLAIDDGASFVEAARLLGRRSGDAIARLVGRFNDEGLAAISPRHGGGPPRRYGAAERDRILREICRRPDPTADEAVTWSLVSLRRALRRAPDSLPAVSTATILRVLTDAGYQWRRAEGWVRTAPAAACRPADVAITKPSADAAPLAPTTR